jgi:hypothetical protein
MTVLAGLAVGVVGFLVIIGFISLIIDGGEI